MLPCSAGHDKSIWHALLNQICHALEISVSALQTAEAPLLFASLEVQQCHQLNPLLHCIDAGDNNVGVGPVSTGSSGGNAVQGGAGGDGGDNNGNTANGGDFNSGDFSGNGGIAIGDNGNGGAGGDAVGGESIFCKVLQAVLPAISSKVSA